MSRITIDYATDLGTTNSAIAVFEGGRVELIKNNQSGEHTPSFVYVTKSSSGESVKRVGVNAKDNRFDHSENVAFRFKRYMNSEWVFHFKSTEEKATAIELSADVLRELIRSVKQRKNEDVRAMVITVPAAFKQPRRDATIEAGKKAGLEQVVLLEEPVAAAYAYLLNDKPKKNVRWLTYDLGGGTFDAALVEINEGIPMFFDNVGDEVLGGTDIDEAIVKECFLPALPAEISEKIKPYKSAAWWKLIKKAEDAKIDLSINDTYDFEVDVGNYPFKYTLIRNTLDKEKDKEKLDTLDKIEEPLISKTIKMCKDLLAKHKFSSQNIDKIILVGGPTLSPYLRKRLQEELRIPLDFSIDPLTVVAQGAAFWARGQRIDIIDKFNDKDVQVKLNYDPFTLNPSPMITGTLMPGKDTFPDEGWSVQIERLDKAGITVEHDSGEINVRKNEEGEIVFKIEMSLREPPEGQLVEENILRLTVFNEKGTLVKANISSFPINVGISVPPQKLTTNLGVVTADNKIVWFFEKGQVIPTIPKERPFKTTVPLQKGRPEVVLEAPIVEGESEKPYLNYEVGVFTVTSENVPHDIDEGATISLSIRVDESRIVSMTGFFEKEGIPVEGKQKWGIEHSREKLERKLNETKEIIEKLGQIEDGDIRRVKNVVEEGGFLEEAEKLIKETTPENPNPREASMELILKAKKLIDPALEKANNIWKKEEEEWQKEIQEHQSAFENLKRGLFPQLPSGGPKNEFMELENEFERAKKERKGDKIIEVLYRKMPNLFKRHNVGEWRDIEIKTPNGKPGEPIIQERYAKSTVRSL